MKCDLWMNLVEPSEFLPNHSNLCSNLRGSLFLSEKEIRIDERISPSVASEDDRDHSEGNPFILFIEKDGHVIIFQFP